MPQCSGLSLWACPLENDTAEDKHMALGSRKVQPNDLSLRSDRVLHICMILHSRKVLHTKSDQPFP